MGSLQVMGGGLGPERMQITGFAGHIHSLFIGAAQDFFIGIWGGKQLCQKAIV